MIHPGRDSEIYKQIFKEILFVQYNVTHKKIILNIICFKIKYSSCFCLLNFNEYNTSLKVGSIN
jgi:hypothetical protein